MLLLRGEADPDLDDAGWELLAFSQHQTFMFQNPVHVHRRYCGLLLALLNTNGKRKIMHACCRANGHSLFAFA